MTASGERWQASLDFLKEITEATKVHVDAIESDSNFSWGANPVLVFVSSSSGTWIEKHFYFGGRDLSLIDY